MSIPIVLSHPLHLRIPCLSLPNVDEGTEVRGVTTILGWPSLLFYIEVYSRPKTIKIPRRPTGELQKRFQYLTNRSMSWRILFWCKVSEGTSIYVIALIQDRSPNTCIQLPLLKTQYGNFLYPSESVGTTDFTLQHDSVRPGTSDPAVRSLPPRSSVSLWFGTEWNTLSRRHNQVKTVHYSFSESRYDVIRK